MTHLKNRTTTKMMVVAGLATLLTISSVSNPVHALLINSLKPLIHCRTQKLSILKNRSRSRRIESQRRFARTNNTPEEDKDDSSGCPCRHPSNQGGSNNNNENLNHRRLFLRDITTTAAASSAFLWGPSPASANNPKSRTEGYAVQRTEREWAYILSGPQYNILRKGGTERQKSSILNTFTAEQNVGTYVCAACPEALFASTDKFNSGTGWPSFAKALPGVEAEQANPIAATLGGREVRCGTCGGHLGDLFNDGWVYVGTSAFETGNRYCIDGAALIFKPADESKSDVYGDQPPPNKVINYEPAMFRDNSINSRL